MKIDRTTKLFLGLIALALWAHVLSPFVQPKVALADTPPNKPKWDTTAAYWPNTASGAVVTATLINAGKDGWEPFAVTHPSFPAPGTAVWFKRQR